MIENLKNNIEQAKKIMEQINSIAIQMQNSELEERQFFQSTIKSLLNQLNILNNAVPLLLKEISVIKKLDEQQVKKSVDIAQISYTSPFSKTTGYVAIDKKDKDRFIGELQMSESRLTELKKVEIKKQGTEKPSQLARISNKWFSNISEKLVPRFSDLNEDLKKANIRFMLSTYISISLFLSLLVFALSLVVFVILGFLFSLFIWIWVPFALGVVSLVICLVYPSLQKGSVEKQVAYELPFATIHMAAIAGSNIEPVKIFKIIAMSTEYPNVGLEIKKMLTQIEIYGYDLVTALKNSAKRTPNSRLGELFSGLATNIVSGGDLKSYLEKKAENFLLDYKLERQRYSALAETFMDIYISILIAAPLVLMMMFIIMNVTGLGVGISLDSILILAVIGVALVNVLFLVVLHFKQPRT